MIAKLKRKPSVLEKFLLTNPKWQEGYKAFSQLYGKPLGFLLVIDADGTHHLIRLDRKNNCKYYSSSPAREKEYEDFLYRYTEILLEEESATLDKFPFVFKTVFDKQCIAFAVRYLGKLKGILYLSSVESSKAEIKKYIQPFDHFLTAQVELSYKNFELNNFYETVHPRALALSTMHSVHRVISSSLRLNELLPRIGRLSAQVLKGRGCSIMLCDKKNEYLIPHFSFGTNSRFIHRQRVRIGRGLEGRIAKTGEFHLSKRSIGVPFIEEDVVGVIVLWDKLDQQSFTKTDLEILKSLSEQAVVAIKNAQLYEETEELTLGSIKTINELLDLTVGEGRGQLPVFKLLVLEVGKDLKLSGRELTNLKRAILLLNTGALTFQDQVWRKKGKLTKKEFEQIKRIPLRGASLLKSISSLKPVVPIVMHHRERFDGSGYPHRLKNEEIPIGARIVSVVDSFIAMISKSSYRDSMSIKAGLSEIKANRGTQFDPEVVDCFLKVAQRKDILDKLKQI